MAFVYTTVIDDADLITPGLSTGSNNYTELDELTTAADYADPLGNGNHNPDDYVYGETDGDDYQVYHSLTDFINTVQDNLVSVQVKVVCLQLKDGSPDAGGTPSTIALRFGLSRDNGSTWTFGTLTDSQDIASAEYIVLTFDITSQNISSWNDEYATNGAPTNWGLDLRGTGSGGSPTNRTTYQISAVIARIEYTATTPSRKRFRVTTN